MATKPHFNFSLCQTVVVVQLDQPRIGLGIIKNQFITVYHQEHRCRGKSSPLVSVNEWVILREAFEESCRFFDHVLIITGLGTTDS